MLPMTSRKDAAYTYASRVLFAEWLTEMRRRKGLTRAALAEAVGVSEWKVATWERAVSVPSVSQIMLLTRSMEPDMPPPRLWPVTGARFGLSS